MVTALTLYSTQNLMKQLLPNTSQSVATTPVLEELRVILYFESGCCSLRLFLNHVSHLLFIVKLSTVIYNDLWRACRSPEVFVNILTHSNIIVLLLVSRQIKQVFCSNPMHVETLCQNSLAWSICDSSLLSHSVHSKTFVFMSSSPIHVWGTLIVSSPEISFSHLIGFCGSCDLFEAKLNADKLLTSGIYWSSKSRQDITCIITSHKITSKWCNLQNEQQMTQQILHYVQPAKKFCHYCPSALTAARLGSNWSLHAVTSDR